MLVTLKRKVKKGQGGQHLHKVPTLNHKILDNSMKLASFVTLRNAINSGTRREMRVLLINSFQQASF